MIGFGGESNLELVGKEKWKAIGGIDGYLNFDFWIWMFGFGCLDLDIWI